MAKQNNTKIAEAANAASAVASTHDAAATGKALEELNANAETAEAQTTATNREAELEEMLEKANQAIDSQSSQLDEKEQVILELTSKLDEATNKVTELSSSLAVAEGQKDDALAVVETQKQTIEELRTAAEGTVLGTIETTDVEVVEAPAPRTFDHNGKRYGFTAKTPAKLNIDGKLLTQDEIIDNPELLASLIVGGCGFIKRV